MKKRQLRLSVLAMSMMAIQSYSYAATEPTFSTMPLRLQNNASIENIEITQPYTEKETEHRDLVTTTSTVKGPKPNVMLVLDDSGSMDEVDNKPLNTKSRMTILKEVMNEVITQNADKVNWGITWFNNAFRLNPDLDLGTAPGTILSNIQGSKEGGPTPTITSVIKAARKLHEGMEYRCQKNYMIVMSDGDANIHSTYNQESDDARATAAGHMAGRHWLYVNTQLNAGRENDVWHRAVGGKYGYKESNSPMATFINKLKHNEFGNPSFTNKKFLFYPYHGIVSAAPAEHNTLPLGTYRIENNIVRYYNSSGQQVNSTALAANLGCSVYGTLPEDFLGREYSTYGENKYCVAPNSNAFGVTAGGRAMHAIKTPIIATKPHYAENLSKHMLKYLTHALAEQDLKKEGDGQGRTYAGSTDKAGQSWDDPLFPKQNITTFTIGFGAGVSARGTDFLRGGATETTDSQGNPVAAYYTASDKTALVSSLNKIFDTIASQNPPPTPGQPTTVKVPSPTGSTSSSPQPLGQAAALSRADSFSSTAPSTTGAGSAQSIPNMAASVFLPGGLTSSELRFFDLDESANVKLDPTTNQPKYRTANFAERKTLIHSGSDVTWADRPSSVFNNRLFNLAADAQGRTDEWRSALLPWIARLTDDNTISSMNYVTPYRTRGVAERNMGDVLDTPVVAQGPRDVLDGGRQRFLVTAANDGLVYLFKSDTNKDAEHPYSLKLNYMPASMPKHNSTLAEDLHKIAHKDYVSVNNPHIYMINGGLSVRATSKSEARPYEQIFMVGNMGQGGRGVYGLNIGGKDFHSGQNIALDNPSSSAWLTEVPLFEANANQSNLSGLGYTVGSPQLGRIRTQRGSDGNVGISKDFRENIRYGAFVGSGYSYPDKTSQETALYIFDALGKDIGTNPSDKTTSGAGQLLLGGKIIVADGVGGLSSPALLDVNFDGVVDYAFAGDYGGNMYRFDLRDPQMPNERRVQRIYTGLPSQPITVAPTISRQPNGRYVVAWGTGTDIYQEDLESKAQQAIYGIYQRFNVNANLEPLDKNEDTPETEFPVSSDKLLAQEFSTTEINGQNFRNVTDNKIFDDTNPRKLLFSGWKVNLGEVDGERVTADGATLLGTLVLSSHMYQRQEKKAPNTTPWDKDTWEQNGWEEVGQPVNSPKVEGTWTAWNKVPGSTSTVNATAPTTSASNDVCVGTTSVSSEKETRERENTWTETKKYQRVHEGEIRSSGWILQLDMTNGGALNTGAGDTELEVGVDFVRAFTRGEGNNKLVGSDSPVFLAGQYVSDGQPNSAILSAEYTGNARNNEGQMNTSGFDEEFDGSGSNIPDVDKRCLSTDKNFNISQNTATGLDANSKQIFGKLCGGNPGIKRISWREIF